MQMSNHASKHACCRPTQKAANMCEAHMLQASTGVIIHMSSHALSMRPTCMLLIYTRSTCTCGTMHQACMLQIHTGTSMHMSDCHMSKQAAQCIGPACSWQLALSHRQQLGALIHLIHTEARLLECCHFWNTYALSCILTVCSSAVSKHANAEHTECSQQILSSAL